MTRRSSINVKPRERVICSVQRVAWGVQRVVVFFMSEEEKINGEGEEEEGESDHEASCGSFGFCHADFYKPSRDGGRLGLA